MNFGFRYHLASLMAVFFSLILGILIGGALFPDHALVEEQALLIAELEERFREVHTSHNTLQAKLDLSTGAWTQLQESISRDILSLKTVVLVDEQDTAYEALAATLRLTGAEVTRIGSESILEVVPDEHTFFVFPLPEGGLSPKLLAKTQRMQEAGARLVFVWDTGQEPVLDEYPPSLRVDSIDNTLGEIALIMGLAEDLQGRFGMQDDAERLFP